MSTFASRLLFGMVLFFAQGAPDARAALIQVSVDLTTTFAADPGGHLGGLSLGDPFSLEIITSDTDTNPSATFGRFEIQSAVFHTPGGPILLEGPGAHLSDPSMIVDLTTPGGPTVAILNQFNEVASSDDIVFFLAGLSGTNPASVSDDVFDGINLNLGNFASVLLGSTQFTVDGDLVNLSYSVDSITVTSVPAPAATVLLASLVLTRRRWRHRMLPA